MYIFLAYWYFALRHTEQIPKPDVLLTVLVNVLFTEALFWTGLQYLDFNKSFSIWRLLGFLLAQDLYFYASHRLFHSVPFLYVFHKVHHQEYSPVCAWHSHLVDHMLINVASVAVSFWLFPNPYWTLVLICIAQCRSSVTGHRDGTPHQLHHLNVQKRLGSVYLFDRLIGSY